MLWDQKKAKKKKKKKRKRKRKESPKQERRNQRNLYPRMPKTCVIAITDWPTHVVHFILFAEELDMMWCDVIEWSYDAIVFLGVGGIEWLLCFYAVSSSSPSFPLFVDRWFPLISSFLPFFRPGDPSNHFSFLFCCLSHILHLSLSSAF